MTTNKNSQEMNLRLSNIKIETIENTCKEYNPNVSDYAEYWPREEVQNNTRLLKGKLRVSKQNRYDAYISVPGIGSDIYIKGDRDRNRALVDDIVYVKLFNAEEWKSVGPPNKRTASCNKEALAKEHEVTVNNLWIPSSYEEIRRESRNSDRAADTTGDTPSFYVNFVENLRVSTSRQPTGFIVYVERGARQEIFGRLQPFRVLKSKSSSLPSSDSLVYFYPSDARLPRFVIPRVQTPSDFQKNPTKFQDKIYVCLFRNWGCTKKSPVGDFVRCAGQAGNIATETQALLIEHDIVNEEFNESILQELEQFEVALGNAKTSDWKIPDSEVQKRRDLRDHRIFTIDPTNARDLDDALHVTTLDDGTIEIGVHIADVTYFVEANTELDKEAKSRATSVYLVNRVIPMLPRLLCEKLCSLNPNVDRLAYSVIWKMNRDGTRVNEKPWLGRTIIRSCCKLDYSTAQRMIDGEISVENCGTSLSNEQWDINRRPSGKHDISDVINDVLTMHTLSAKRRAKRFASGALILERGKLAFELDENENPVGVGEYPIRESNKLIEEYMLMANFLVADFLLAKVGEHAVLRRHAPPDEDKLSKIISQASLKNISIDGSNSAALAKSIQDLRTSNIDSRPDHSTSLSRVFEALLTGPMHLAQYFCVGNSETEFWRHYALNIPHYTHFTSPIRRYADIMVHRLLTCALTVPGGALDEALSKDFNLPDLDTAVKNCNDRNLASKTVQEKQSYVYLCSYLHHSGSGNEVVNGIVTGLGQRSFSVFINKYNLESRIFLSKQFKSCTTEYDEEQEILRLISCNDRVLKKPLVISFLGVVSLRLSVKMTSPVQISYQIIV